MNARPVACDQCHALKMRCVYQDALSRLACIRCWRSAKTCTSNRERLTTGRPRKVKASKQPQSSNEFVWTYVQNQKEAQASTICPDNESNTPKSDGSDCRITQGRLSLTSARPRNVLLSGLNPSERLLLELIFHTPTFIRHFVLASTFADGILTPLYARVCTSPEILRNIFLANAGQFARRTGLYLTDGGDPNNDFTNGARAVEDLRAAETQAIQHEADLIRFLTLALGIVTFDLFVTGGLHVQSVSRFAVGLLRHVPPWLPLSKQLEHQLVPLVFCDTINSLVKGQVPLLKFQSQDLQLVDRYIGLCSPLLPHLYDICYVGHALHASHASGNSIPRTMNPELDAQLHRLENAIEFWVPLAPAEFVASHSEHDVTVIEAQARIYQYSALLAIERLRYQFSIRSDAAGNLSLLIISNIRQLLDPAMPDQAHEYRLTFPYFMAALEVEDAQERNELIQLLPKIASPQIYPHVNSMLLRFLEYYWRVNDENPRIPWFDIVSSGPAFALF